MGIATGLTAARMQEIIDRQIVSGAVDLSGNLVMTREDGSSFDAGMVKGDKGDKGDSAIYPLPGFPNSASGSYVRLLTLDGVNASNGAHAQFMISGIGDFGSNKRGTVLVHVGQRGADIINVKAWHWGLDEMPANQIRIYTKKLGTYLYEVWAQFAPWTAKPTFTEQSFWHGTRNLDSNTTVAPTSLVEAVITQSSAPFATSTEVADGLRADAAVTPASLRDSGGGDPPGVISMWSTAVAPNGFLLCQGQAVSRTTYARLYAVIGTTYGAGNGSTTFNVPNLQGRVPVGQDSTQTEFDVLGETGGAKTHTLSQAEMPSHAHTHSGHSWAWGPSGNVHIKIDAQGGSGSANQLHTWQNQPGWETVNATGGGGAHNNIQPYLVLNYIIKF